MQMQAVKIRVRSYGKAPKEYGSNALKFSFEVVSILEHSGWKQLGNGRSYAYLASPNGYSQKNVIISTRVPMDIEIERLSCELHEKRKKFLGETDGWFVTYQPAKPDYSMQVDLMDRGKQIGPVEHNSSSSFFQVGSLDTWYVRLVWEDGDDEPPVWFRSEERLLADDPQSALFVEAEEQSVPVARADNTLPSSNELREGEVQQEIVNRYERSSEARRRCIEHYGVSCAVCDFNFAKEYGDIGRNFIHVHHTMPLAARGGKYEVDPIRDLIPVCPNCHAMLHQVSPPYSIAELTSIRENQNRTA